MDRSLVVLHTECAALRGAPHLIELGAVRVRGGESLEHFEALVRPSVPIEPAATDVHGITDDAVRDAPDPPTVLATFGEWVGEDWMVAHDAGADASALGFEYRRAGIEPPAGPLLDTLALARACLPEAQDHGLEALARHLELEEGPSHRALADATTCWQVLEACIERLGGWDAIGEAKLLRSSGIPLSLGSCGPRPPRRHRARARALDRAGREGGQVVLVYGGRDEPPARLPVQPRLVYELNGRDYMEGEDGRTGTLKTYRLDRIQRVEAP